MLGYMVLGFRDSGIKVNRLFGIKISGLIGCKVKFLIIKLTVFQGFRVLKLLFSGLRL
jgi:hypothetical protein